MHVTRIWNVATASIVLTEPPQWRSVLAVTSRVSYFKRSEFGLKKELHADPRVVLEGNFSFRPRQYLPATFLCARPGEGFSHETRYQAEHDRAEVCKSETGREPASGQDAPEGLHANKTAPRKVPDLFQNAEVRN